MNIVIRKCISLISLLTIAAGSVYAQTHFAFTSSTGNDMTVVVPASVNPTIDGVALANDDEIGVFTPEGLCVAAVVWNGSASVIPVHGDNDMTAIVDGIAAGEQLLFRVWDASLSKEGTATVAYSLGGPNYSVDGMAVLSSLTAVSSSSSSYRVTYDGNGNTGGTAPTDANTYLPGVMVTVLSNTGALTRTGFAFTGWNTAADGSGTNYSANATFAMSTSDVTLYAQWTLNPTYSVTYNGNGNTAGSAPTGPNNYQSGASVTVLGNTGGLAKNGYIFSGWNAGADGSGANYAAGATFGMGTSNVTLYAKWTVIPTYTVTYNGNGNTGGTIPTDANNYQQAATVTVLGNTGSLVKTGYAFSSWNTAANGSGASCPVGQTFAMGGANVVLYAQWNITTSTLSIGHILGNTAPVADKDTMVSYGDTLQIHATAIPGNIFTKWRITAGTAVLIDSTAQIGKIIVTGGNATLMAIYSIATGILNQMRLLPTAFDLSYYAGTSNIEVTIPCNSGFSNIPVRICFYDAKGRLLFVLADKEMQPGYYTLRLPMETNLMPMWGICRMNAKGFGKTIKVMGNNRNFFGLLKNN